MTKPKKIILGIIGFIVTASFALAVFFYLQFEPTKNPGLGLTFSRTHAEYLGLDWKETYLAILNDLKPKKLRLVAYWEIMEKEPNLWYFQDIDEMLVEAEKHDVEVILAVGLKLPRWPECHYPAWFNDLNDAEKRERHLNMIEMAVNHFKGHEVIKIWQLENEALFNFGYKCPKIDKELLKEELELVRNLDSRPILMSDSGELGRWVPTANLKPDILGSTMYRVVHNPKIGYFYYPLPPAFFRIKAGLTETMTGMKRFKGVELQAEPWFASDIAVTDLQTQFQLMNPSILKDNLEYAKKAGFEDHYLWGVEWWYWLAQKKNDWGMWDTAKSIFRNSGG
ncbi:MAG TPA: hypothetical protein VD998_02220 [Verrucomicrobiae bacterium]|nr:hypothetical protein [Verrucomicrobiae bacterium]